MVTKFFSFRIDTPRPAQLKSGPLADLLNAHRTARTARGSQQNPQTAEGWRQSRRVPTGVLLAGASEAGARYETRNDGYKPTSRLFEKG